MADSADSGRYVPEMLAQKCCLFPYLQGGRIARSTFTSGSTVTAAELGGAGRIVTVVGGRRELGDLDRGHGNKGKGEYHVSQA
jgi:hypothetical protein